MACRNDKELEDDDVISQESQLQCEALTMPNSINASEVDAIGNDPPNNPPCPVIKDVSALGLTLIDNARKLSGEVREFIVGLQQEQNVSNDRPLENENRKQQEELQEIEESQMTDVCSGVQGSGLLNETNYTSPGRIVDGSTDSEAYESIGQMRTNAIQTIDMPHFQPNNEWVVTEQGIILPMIHSLTVSSVPHSGQKYNVCMSDTKTSFCSTNNTISPLSSYSQSNFSGNYRTHSMITTPIPSTSSGPNNHPESDDNHLWYLTYEFMIKLLEQIGPWDPGNPEEIRSPVTFVHEFSRTIYPMVENVFHQIIWFAYLLQQSPITENTGSKIKEMNKRSFLQFSDARYIFLADHWSFRHQHAWKSEFHSLKKLDGDPSTFAERWFNFLNDITVEEIKLSEEDIVRLIYAKIGDSIDFYWEFSSAPATKKELTKIVKKLILRDRSKSRFN